MGRCKAEGSAGGSGDITLDALALYDTVQQLYKSLQEVTVPNCNFIQEKIKIASDQAKKKAEEKAARARALKQNQASDAKAKDESEGNK